MRYGVDAALICDVLFLAFRRHYVSAMQPRIRYRLFVKSRNSSLRPHLEKGVEGELEAG